MKHGKSISIIIPALNEEEGIKATINSLPLNEIRAAGHDVEILVVDGNSSDKTYKSASDLGAIVLVESRKGYGRAYKTGFSHAQGNIIVTLDADGTYPSGMIPKLVRDLEQNNLDFITVNRFSKLEKGSMSRTHMFGNFILTICLRMLYSFNIKDSQSGMWILRKELIDNIKLLSDDMALSEELKIIAFTYFKSVEVDGGYSKRVGEAKLATLGHGWRNLRYLLTYRNRKRFAVRQSMVSRTIQTERVRKAS